MSKAVHRRANNVLKFLRWRSTTPEGAVAYVFVGIEFDAVEVGGAPLTTLRSWVGVAHGHAGHWSDALFEWLWKRGWVDLWPPEQLRRAQGGL